MRERRSLVVLAGLLASRAVHAPTASAWTGIDACGGGWSEWPGATFPVHISSADYPATGWQHDAIHDIASRFGGFGTPIDGTSFEVNLLTHTTNASANIGDGESTINLDNITGVGLASWWTNSSCEITECDIQLDSSRTWSDGAPPDETAPPYSFQAILASEMGHCAGLDHVSGYPDNLNETNPAGGSIAGAVRVMEDAREGLRAIYPHSSTGTDVGEAAFYWHGSQNKAVRSPADDGTRIGVDACWDQNSSASPGGSVYRLHCIHDLGTSTVTVAQKYFLSLDQTFSSGDVIIGSFTPNVGPNTPYCPCRTLTIPSGTSSDTYYLGSVLDPDNTVSETNENNNVAWDDSTFTVL